MDVAELGFVADTKSLERANRELEKLPGNAQKSERATDRFNRELKEGSGAADRLERELSRMNRTINGMSGLIRNLVASFAAWFSIQALIEMTNTWTDLNSRVNIAVGSIETGRAVMQRLEEMARRTYSSLNLTAESFLLNAKALQELGYSTNQQLDFTESLNNALVVSGAKGDRAASVLNAISKAMALGQLRGEELNTVIQSGGRVSQALAEGMGVATTELRSLGMQGKITSDVLFNSVVSQLETLREEADGMAATIGDAFVILQNSLMGFVGGLDQATGASSAVAQGIIFIADNLGPLAEHIAIVGTALLAAFGPRMIWLIGTGMVTAIKILTVAIAANPIGALWVAIVGITTAVWIFRDAISNAIGVDVTEIFKTTGNNIIRFFLTAFEEIKFIWSNFPSVIGNAAIGAANFVIRAINDMIQFAVAGINQLIASVRMIPGLSGLQDLTIGDPLKELDMLGGRELAMASLRRDLNKMVIAETDYVGALASAMGDLSTATTDVAGAMDEIGGTGGTGGTGSGGGGAAERMAEGLKSIQSAAEAAQEKIDALRDVLEDTIGGAFKSFFTDVRKGVSAIDALNNALGRLEDKLWDMLLDQIVTGFFGSIFGGSGLGGVGQGLTGAATYGFTGRGVYGIPTGAASGGARAAASAVSGGVAMLQPIINNNAANDVEASAGIDNNGQFVVQIDRMIADRVGDTGSRANRAIRQSFGLQHATKPR